jgi:uncharacterized membrane protein YfcA
MLLPMIVGLWAGSKVHSKMSSSGILKIYGSILLFSGAMLLLKGASKVSSDFVKRLCLDS